MVAFGLDADTTHPPDFALLRDGGLALFRRPAVLDDAEQELRGLGYDQVRLDAGGWTESDLHDAFASALTLPGLLRAEPERTRGLPLRRGAWGLRLGAYKHWPCGAG